MPSTKRQFELGVDDEGESLMRRVYELLADNPDLAYSHKELEKAVYDAPAAVTRLGKFRRAVDALVSIGAADVRKVARTNYYGYLREFDTDTWKSVRLPG